MDDKQLSFILLACLFVGALYLTYIIFRPFLAALFLALVLAITFFPLHKRIVHRVRNANAAALITTSLAIVIILVPVILVSVRLSAEIINIYRSVLQPLGSPAGWPDRLDPLIEQAAERTGVPAGQLKADITLRMSAVGSWLLGFASSLGGRFAQQMMTTALAFTFLFSILRDSDDFQLGVVCILPLSPQRARELAATVNDAIIANIYGMLAVGVAEGILITIGFWIAGLGSPLLWGAIATVLSCLPAVGVSLVWVPACVVLALRGNWTSAILLFVWGLIVVAASEGIVRSRVVSGRVKINSLLITLSLLGGLAVFGAIGFLVAPVVLALVAALLRILREEHASVNESRNRAA
jgi:predicted PurR-regulated permease PerM